MEEEKNTQLAFLYVFICGKDCGDLKTKVFRKATNKISPAKESDGRVRVRGSCCRRLHLFSRGCPNDTLLVDIKGPPGATFKVRLSTRTSPLHRISGYPQVPPDHKVHVCRLDEEKVRTEGRTVPQLELSWPPTEHSEEQQTVYCVAINDRESLLHQCSAATRLHSPSGRLHPQARFDQSYLLRPAVFGKTAALRSAPIRNYIYSCTNATELRVTLPDPLARRLSSLDKEGQLFINVYAVNQDSQLSTSYPAVVLGPRSPLDYCNAPARARKAHMPMEDRLSTQLTVHNLRWRTDLDFDLPVGNLQLLFQPCLLGDRPYLVQVYRQAPIHKERNNIGVPACQLVVDRGHSVQLCTSISPGSYRIHVSETRSPNTSYSSSAYSAGSFVLSQRIGRVFFVPPDLSPLPQRPRHASE
ncbi:unnamed protein product [Dibothriocephalus latus]|uniref:Uncharacterized protein n=1 Tax=Dibothriocephalus latus TaxID=60516 RepID=A0A3P6TDV8_DIBLA|nr:unnamed protein product [Dibothriocephalus latus]